MSHQNKYLFGVNSIVRDDYASYELCSLLYDTTRWLCRTPCRKLTLWEVCTCTNRSLCGTAACEITRAQAFVSKITNQTGMSISFQNRRFWVPPARPSNFSWTQKPQLVELQRKLGIIFKTKHPTCDVNLWENTTRDREPTQVPLLRTGPTLSL